MTDREKTPSGALGRLAELPRARLFHAPTHLEFMPNLTAACGGKRALYVKRDDLTDMAFGGNKVRQLEFYLGEAQAQGADTVLITGAVQSNFARLTAAGARKLGMESHIQWEERVAKQDPRYRNSGNVLIERILGATLHSYPLGEDETGADRRLGEIAEELRQAGRKPYVIPLAPGHAPLGALGYVVAARELLQQITAAELAVDGIVVASGSGATHAGLLFGLRALGSSIPVTGICVRRDAAAQGPRITQRCAEIAELLQIKNRVAVEDVVVTDAFLAPGYGRASEEVLDAIRLAARTEALMLDPVYSGKTMAGFVSTARQAEGEGALIFIHTGGTPGIFAYEDDLTA
ncbi:D-cysteine desulfhydrase family protein [Denitrobaculum tricleocarpae]|uniref:D-cysteine desulfhydrase family protein n=1 Tax=Denitrobaculum tricleocarpae TaxID=2591009 RepID=A0A545TF15_9PROT|nr:D-cysteine desulfhydrase family protein [Denitrobaculum tricleocarpae]TQV75819.1 D-cysteine desulfhydrase family protein [Denitrobaculum tricleocarpae]